jgi:hypothetical protein
MSQLKRFFVADLAISLALLKYFKNYNLWSAILCRFVIISKKALNKSKRIYQNPLNPA